MTTPATTHDADLAKLEELLKEVLHCSYENGRGKGKFGPLREESQLAAQALREFVSASLRDKARIDMIEEQKRRIWYSDMADGFVVQHNCQVVGKIGTGKTLREALDNSAARKEGQP